MKTDVKPRLQELAALSGLISAEAGERLMSLAADIPGDLAIVELGAYRGKSSCYLAEGARLGNGARVYSVDAWDLPENADGRHGYNVARAEFDRQVRSLKLDVRAIKGYSAAVGRDWLKPVGLLFVDASHEYNDVREDFEAWHHALADGAVVVFDDYDTPKNPGVKRFVDERFEAVDLATPSLAIVRT